MARPLGSKNKTPSELKLDAEMLKKKAEMQLIKIKRRELARERQVSQLSEEDVHRLLQLCHPDKHNGSSLAVEMTQKLLTIKESQ